MDMKKAVVAAALALPLADAFAPSPMSTAFSKPALRAQSSRTEAAPLALEMARRPFIAGNWKMNPETLDDAVKLAKSIAEASKTATAQVAICAPHPYLWSVGNEFKGSNVELGAQVLCGHSERRTIFHNDDSSVNKKVQKVLKNGLEPMLCIGESKNEYEEGLVESVHEFIRSHIAKMYDQATADETRILYGGSVTGETVDELMRRPDIDGCLVGGASLAADSFGRIMNFQK